MSSIFQVPPSRFILYSDLVAVGSEIRTVAAFPAMLSTSADFGSSRLSWWRAIASHSCGLSSNRTFRKCCVIRPHATFSSFVVR
jgi:hypothetical protein